jgi:hypothetical protein
MLGTKPNTRRIRRSISYTVPELASALGIAIGTIRRWVRLGMPLVDKERPKLVNGAEFLAWHNARCAARKSKCGPRQMYCFRCRDARDLMPGSALIIHRNEKCSSIKGLCISCGTPMNRHCSRQNAVSWIPLSRPLKGQKLHLLVSPTRLVNDAFGAPLEAGVETRS